MSEVLQNLEHRQVRVWEEDLDEKKVVKGESVALRGMIMPASEVELRFGIEHYNWMTAIKTGSDDIYHIFQTPVPDRHASTRQLSRLITTQIPGVWGRPNLFEIPGSVGVMSERLLGSLAAHKAGTVFMSEDDDSRFWEEIHTDLGPHIAQMARCTQLTIGDDLDMTKLRPEGGPPRRAIIKLDAAGLIRIKALDDTVTLVVPRTA